MVFHWSLSDSKSPQVSRTRLRILAVLSNAVVWIVSTRPPTSKSSRPFNNPLVIVSKAPITIGTIVTFMCHRFFNSLASYIYITFIIIIIIIEKATQKLTSFLLPAHKYYIIKRLTTQSLYIYKYIYIYIYIYSIHGI